MTGNGAHAVRPGTGTQRFLRWWAVLLLFTSLAVGSLMVFTFGAVTFATFFVLWLRDIRSRPVQPLDRVAGLLLGLSTLWFLLNLAIELLMIFPETRSPDLYVLLMVAAYLYPPVIMHQMYLEREPLLTPHRRYRIPYLVAYGLSITLAGSVSIGWIGSLLVFTGSTQMVLQIGLFIMFLVVAIYSVVSNSKARNRVQPDERKAFRWNLALFAVTLSIFILLAIVLLSGAGLWLSYGVLFNYFGLFSRALPLCFFFVGTYYQDRFAFFDVFIKRGTFFFLLLLVLLGYFALVTSPLDRAPVGWLKPWIFSLTLAPILLALPWAYRILGLMLDRFWLGRRFSPIEAVKYFLSGMRDATEEATLARRAEQKLSVIFQAEAAIILEPAADPGTPEAVQPIPIRVQGTTVGRIRMGRRLNETPYFSEDLALLSSIADVFSSLLENLRLQQKKQDQERREQELRLVASRSELKALRAQVNPHFLFNALNAIAGLIHKNPSLAEQTVEELSEVFRYTLKRSEKELARLDEELDFVQAYLNVEKARFRDRLVIQMDVDEEVRSEVIPTMAIQTLVENAIKHGISAVRGVGIIEIRAKREGNRLCLEVLDNGPALKSLEPAEDAAGAESGYGLRNLRSRLRTHFGDRGELTVRRDSTGKITIATIHMPASAL